MQENELEQLKKLAKSLREYSGKIKIISLLNKAKLEYDSNKFLDCEQSCKEILIIDSQNAVALRGLGCVAQAGGNYKKAEKYYKKALKFSKNKEIECTLIGTIYYLQEDLETALKYYNKAIDINDDYDNAYEGKNQAMLEKHLKLIDLQDSLIKQKIFY